MARPLALIQEGIERSVAYMMNMLKVKFPTHAFDTQEDIAAWVEAFEKKDTTVNEFLHFIGLTQCTVTTEMIPSDDKLGVTIIVKFSDREKNLKCTKTTEGRKLLEENETEEHSWIYYGRGILVLYDNEARVHSNYERSHGNESFVEFESNDPNIVRKIAEYYSGLLLSGISHEKYAETLLEQGLIDLMKIIVVERSENTRASIAAMKRQALNTLKLIMIFGLQ